MYRLALFWFFLLVAKYRLAYTPDLHSQSHFVWAIYRLGYIEVLALAVYNLAIYIPLLCTLQTEEPGAPGFQVRPEAHRNSVDSGMHRLHGGTSWRESSLKFIALSRQKTSVRTRLSDAPTWRSNARRTKRSVLPGAPVEPILRTCPGMCRKRLCLFDCDGRC